MLVYQNGTVQDVETRVPSGAEIGWLHLDDPSSETVHSVLGEMFGCHPLVIEDVIHFGQRPKLDHYPKHHEPHAFVSFYAIHSDLSTTEFCIVISRRYIITVSRKPLPFISQLYERVGQNPALMSSTGELLYRLLDACVDEYFGIVDHLEDRVDRLEQRVFHHPEAHTAPDIFRLKRRLQKLRRITSECRNVVGMLAHETFPYTEDEHEVYFVDVYDHASRVVDALDAIRDNLSGLLDLQTAQRANRMNEVMKTLTIISTIFLPLSFIVGLYGMNFKDIPELNWRFGYLYCWVLLILVTALFVTYFKRKGWW
jgi:magnesium transporter